MMLSQEIKCYHCNKVFYLNLYRYREANTISCIECGKRIIKLKAEVKNM